MVATEYCIHDIIAHDQTIIERREGSYVDWGEFDPGALGDSLCLVKIWGPQLNRGLWDIQTGSRSSGAYCYREMEGDSIYTFWIRSVGVALTSLI